MSKNGYYLAFDIGTTNWKAAIFNEKGVLVDIERTPTRTHIDENGNSYYDAVELWETVCRLSRTVTGRLGKPISAVSVTSVAEAVAAIDQEGNAVGNVITWYDTRAIGQAEELKTLFGEKHLYEITGLDVNPIFSLPKIMWLRRYEPFVYEKAHKWLQMADYVIYKLTGEAVTDYTLASRTLAFDVVKNEWAKEIFERLDIPVEAFPEIKESGTLIGRISAQVEAETGITRDAKVAVGGHDHPCASIAAGVMRGDKILDSSGTAESFIYISEHNAVPKMEFAGQRTCRYLEKSRYALWGGIISSGRSMDWAYENLVSPKVFGIEQKAAYQDILEQLSGVKGMESGLIFYPHLRGAGAPYWNPKISGSFIGIRDIHTSKNMLRSVLEGLSMQARMIVEMEEKLAGRQVDSLCVVGGSSRNLQWQRIKASVVNKPVELCFEAEATAQGAAMLAAISDGVYENIHQASERISADNRIIEPEEALVRRYENYYDLYCEGYRQLEKLNELIYDEVRK